MANEKWNVIPAQGEMPSAIIHGEAPPIRMVSSDARFGTYDDIIKQANAIWEEIKKSPTLASDEKGNDNLLSAMQEKYKDFGISFPIPLRWAVQARVYDSGAFRKFLTYYQTQTKTAPGTGGAVFDTRDRFLEVQAEYLVYIQKAQNPHYDMERLRKYREYVNAQLKKEDKDFAKIQEEVAEALRQSEVEQDKKRRAAIYQALLAERVAAETKTG